MCRRTRPLIGRLPITGFHTRLESGSNLRRPCVARVYPPTGAPAAVRDWDAVRPPRPPVRGPVRCVDCTRFGSRSSAWAPWRITTGVLRRGRSYPVGSLLSPFPRVNGTDGELGSSPRGKLGGRFVQTEQAVGERRSHACG